MIDITIPPAPLCKGTDYEKDSDDFIHMAKAFNEWAVEVNEVIDEENRKTYGELYVLASRLNIEDLLKFKYDIDILLEKKRSNKMKADKCCKFKDGDKSSSFNDTKGNNDSNFIGLFPIVG